MKQVLFVTISLIVILNCSGQNVGVGTITPAEKLDVNGNINLSGQLKVNNNAGAANQVLMKDASNNLVWGDLSEFKNLRVFDCSSIAFSAGSSNCADVFNIPAGVTSILVECWGGGGGGSTLTGGGGGGYISAKLTVTPLSSATLTIGAGGNYGSGNGISGGNTSFVISGITLQANGGDGGFGGDPTVTFLPIGQATGGGFAVTGITNQFIGFYGSPGGLSKLSFMTASATDFAKIVNYGDGGDAALLPGSGSKGGYRMVSISVNQAIYATSFGIQPGGGGGADIAGGFYGRGGRIIVRW
ncbi:MAG: hypothetical protein HOP10_14390 [Chitinophagaceae bacterium]|nr:hypothetical protein [Chitinophagaceae bacterium]